MLVLGSNHHATKEYVFDMGGRRSVWIAHYEARGVAKRVISSLYSSQLSVLTQILPRMDFVPPSKDSRLASSSSHPKSHYFLSISHGGSWRRKGKKMVNVGERPTEVDSSSEFGVH